MECEAVKECPFATLLAADGVTFAATLAPIDILAIRCMEPMGRLAAPLIGPVIRHTSGDGPSQDSKTLFFGSSSLAAY